MSGLRHFTTKDLNALILGNERFSIGYDNTLFRMHSYGVEEQRNAYPPFNVIRTDGENYKIEIALAGWAKEEIDITTQTNVLLIKPKQPKEKLDVDYEHQGIAGRTFARKFNLSDDMQVGRRKFIDGMLTIEIHKVVPEHQKLKHYEIE